MKKQIEEITEILANSCKMGGCEECKYSEDKYPECALKYTADKIYNAGYHKIYDDHQRQCACYSLGCQMADSIEKKVAGEFIEAVDQMMELVVAMTGCSFTYFGKYAELKKKYIGKDTNVTTNTEDEE